MCCWVGSEIICRCAHSRKVVSHALGVIGGVFLPAPPRRRLTPYKWAGGPGGRVTTSCAPDPHRGRTKVRTRMKKRFLAGWQMDRDELWSRAKSQNLFFSLLESVSCVLLEMLAVTACRGVSLFRGYRQGWANATSTLFGLFCRRTHTARPFNGNSCASKLMDYSKSYESRRARTQYLH